MRPLTVGDPATWRGYTARVAVVMEHPAGYILEYTVEGGPEWGKTAVVKANELGPRSLPDLFAEKRALEARLERVLVEIAELQGER